MTPPPPTVEKGPRFPHLSPPKSKFFDMPTVAFLLLAAWLFFYLLDRLYFEGDGYRAVKTCLEHGMAILHLR